MLAKIFIRILFVFSFIFLKTGHAENENPIDLVLQYATSAVDSIASDQIFLYPDKVYFGEEEIFVECNEEEVIAIPYAYSYESNF